MLIAVVGLTVVDRAEAQYYTSYSSYTLNSYEDTFYDFEVYAAEEPGDGYFILWEMSDGSTIKYGPYYSYSDAQNRLMKILFGGWEPDGYVDVDIVELPLEPDFVLFDTVGTRAAANELADQLESLGLLTNIRRISSYRFYTR
jgi:hypothetical protein